MSTTEWIALGAVVLSAGAGGGRLIFLLGALNNKVAGLAQAIAGLAQQARDDRDERRRIWERLDKHGQRIARLEGEEADDVS